MTSDLIRAASLAVTGLPLASRYLNVRPLLTRRIPGFSSLVYRSRAARADASGSLPADTVSFRAFAFAMLEFGTPLRSNMKCPKCASARVYPSRLRNGLEKLRQKMTDRQPYRCHECGWRKWREVEFLSANPDVRPEDLRTGRGVPPVSTNEVDQLDPA